MKVLDVEPVKSAGGDCFDDVIVTMEGWYNRGYKLMYANALKFEFAPPKPGATFGSRMQTGVSNSLTLLGQFHGYEIHVTRNISTDDSIALIQEQLGKGNPVCLNFDTYYSPWDGNFGKFHYLSHVMIVVGIDSITGEYLIVDPYFSKKDLRLSKELFSNGLLGVMTIEPSPGGALDREVTLDRLRQLLREHLNTSPDHFQRFADEIGDICFEDEAAEGDSRFIASTMFILLNVLHTNRINYTHMLEYVANTFGVSELNACIEDVRRLSNPWSTVRGMLAKISFMPPERRDAKLMASLGTKIRNATDTEVQVLQRVLAILDGDGQSCEALVAAGSSISDSTRLVVPIDISRLCTVRGIDNGLGTADVDGDGHSYSREHLPEDGILRVGDLSFVFPATGNADDYDNAVCYGQAIPIPPDQYQGLTVLASSQFGGSADAFTIEYADGTSEQLQLGFADWWSHYPIAGEKVAWTADLIRNSEGKTENTVYLFANEAPLSRSGSTAIQLVLPTIPNLHVFAISLWK
ncbi:hypothetical protein PaecuDRAFT_4686 [Paenibacillus curdlanolyticus YK9]|uniref:Butirosin biosynthesis protein H N-terminal domain-containing protein n=1 Tax=Paenibacillus curdlanolyticus YK9 TaxID=717606 RepID=E0IG95_9BACL|nr:BtrH N-terminal domain-containing protein [Paenibacillus curdlanolyticus]EFM08497.1 hypothetical protein PaecuDRAFT_4686 [Paenibacillus curdlanolyticus YK9]